MFILKAWGVMLSHFAINLLSTFPLLFLIARGRIEVRISQGHSILASFKSHARESHRVTTAKCELICNLHINRFADAATRRVGPSFVNVNGPPSLLGSSKCE